MTDQRPQTLTRADLIDGLRELSAGLRVAGTPARFRIVGGAAIALTLNADRAGTVDIDGPLDPSEPILAAARGLADRHGWRQDWINDAAKVLLPIGYGDRFAEWNTVHDDGQIHVQIAVPETLLAMKLHAAKGHGSHDAPDLAVLLPHCNITTAEQAERLYEAYYPGDSLTPRATQLLEHILGRSLEPPAAPPHLSLG